MPLCEARDYRWYDPLVDESHVQVLMVRRSENDPATKIIQTASHDPARATFETGRYVVIEDGFPVDKVCLSTQIGCARGCSFCESGRPFDYWQGSFPIRLYRNLSTEELVEQAENAIKVVPPIDHRRLTFAFMGMGEPFDTIDSVIAATHSLTLLNPGANFTVSTIGHRLGNTPGTFGIMDLADRVAGGEFNRPVRLHISLHGSDDVQRKQIVPYAPPLRAVLDAAEYYADRTRTTVKLNYVLVEGVNATEDDAHRIGKALQARQSLVLKISTLNATEGVVDTQSADRFEQIVGSYGVKTYRFTSLGGDVVGRCGEFAKRQMMPTVLVRLLDPADNILLLQRSPQAGDYQSRWSFISGGIEQEDEEDPFLAAVREVYQETGDGELGRHIGGVGYYGPYTYVPPHCTTNFYYLVHVFDFRLNQQIPVNLNSENVNFTWVKGEDLSHYDLAEPLLDGQLDVFHITK